jgi:hypothetical protein
MKQAILHIFLFFCIHSLTSFNDLVSQVHNIDLITSFKERKNIPLSKFVEAVSYIPLETNPEIVLDGSAEFEVTDQFIIVKTGKTAGKYQILLFDRKTGRFIREIAKQGRGPEEYQTFSYIPFNYVTKEIYALGQSRQILAYNLNGKIVNRIGLPVWKDIGVPSSEVSNKTYNIFQSVYVQYYNTLDTNIFVGYVRNKSGLEKRKIVLFSKDGFLKVFPNYITFHHDNMRQSWNPPGQSAKFYKWNNELFFIEAFCDTLYKITKDKMIPRYYFNFGKFNPPYSKQPEIMLEKHWPEYFFITNICENQNFIFFSFELKNLNYLAILDKKKEKVEICMTSFSGKSALKDDITGLIEVSPQSFTQNNEMVYVIRPLDLLNWLKENPNNSMLLKERLPWLKEIDEFSNPVIAIGKCNTKNR